MNTYKKLVELVFEKARAETGSEVLTQQAKYIVDEIEKKLGFIITNKTLRNYYNGLIKGKNPNINIRPEIADQLACFLDYNDFSDFKAQNLIIKEKSKSRNPQKAIIGSLILVASYFGYDSLSSKCMIWTDNNKYEKIACEESNTIPYDETLLDFKRVEPDANYMFFNEDGSANLWYGKSVNGDYEYFNNFGIHPITGKTLKEISIYMINKHIKNTNN